MVRLVADGAVAWERAYSGEHKYDVACGLARTQDGGLVIVGATMANGSGKTNVWLLRLDRERRQLWDRVFGSVS